MRKVAGEDSGSTAVEMAQLASRLETLCVVRNTEVWRGSQRMRRATEGDGGDVEAGDTSSKSSPCANLIGNLGKKGEAKQDPYGMVQASWLHGLGLDEEIVEVDLSEHIYKTGTVQDGGIAPVWLPEHLPVVCIPWEARIADLKDRDRMCKITLWDADFGMGADDIIGEGLLAHRSISSAVKMPNKETGKMDIALIAIHDDDEEEEQEEEEFGRMPVAQSFRDSQTLDAAGTLFVTLKYVVGEGLTKGEEPRLEIKFIRAEGLPDKEHTKIANINELYDPTLILMWIPVVIAYIAVGVMYYYFRTKFSFIDALYFCWVTFTTVGYGDHGKFGTFYDEEGHAHSDVAIFTSFYMLSGVLVMGIAATLYLNLVSKMIGKFVRFFNRKRKNYAKHHRMKKLLCGNMMLVERCRKGRSFNCNPEFVDVGVTMVSVLVILIAAAAFIAVDQNLTFGQGFYFACSTATTVGYGDLSLETKTGKIIALFLLPAGTVLTAKTLGDMSGLLFRIQSMKMESKVMKQFGSGIHFQDFADLKKQIGSDPQNARITKNEFLLAMIMRLGRLRETDRALIMGIYNDLDTDRSGDLDISDCAFAQLRISRRDPAPPSIRAPSSHTLAHSLRSHRPRQRTTGVAGSVPTSVLLKHSILRDEDWIADGDPVANAPSVKVRRQSSSFNAALLEQRH